MFKSIKKFTKMFNQIDGAVADINRCHVAISAAARVFDKWEQSILWEESPFRRFDDTMSKVTAIFDD